MQTVVSSNYIKQQRRDYFLYTISSRAIPYLSDGLKPAQRRVLWIGRNGEKTKTATLAGATMPIHPHASPDDVISNMAGPWCNNICLFDGHGAFGTLVNPTSFGAPRYTSVKISEFTKDVVFADIDIIPMKLNYDDTQEEPVHFLPLIPVVLLNPTFGIAGGFQSNILPYDLTDIVNAQINYLTKKEIIEAKPYFKPIDCRATEKTIDSKTQNVRFTFEGNFDVLNSSEICINKLPYGVVHSKYIDYLIKLEEEYKISGFEDRSKDSINIIVKFPRGFVNKTSHSEMLRLLKLVNVETEIMNVIDFDGQTVLNTNFVDVIKKFTDWRLQFYYKRYERLLSLLEIEIQKLKDIITAINKNVGGLAVKVKSRSELEEFLQALKIVNIDYIASLPVYRFTEEEKNKTQQKLEDALKQQKYYIDLLTHEEKRVKIYVDELKEVLKKYGKT